MKRTIIISLFSLLLGALAMMAWPGMSMPKLHVEGCWLMDEFAAGWKNQIEPCAAIAPILVTEMDWLPSKYQASWGKSITGQMLG